MNPRRHLVVFARRPRIGRVKSRLASDIGVVAAWGFYRRTLKAVARPLIRDRRWRCWFAVTPDAAIHDRRTWPAGCTLTGQGGGDLGRRMARVAEVLPTGPVVIVGADVPGIRPRHIADAFKALGRHDAVFGPAEDGGYWLVGLKRRPRFLDIFTPVRWSTEYALADTITNLDGGSYALLETLADIDDGEAYGKWKKGGC